MSDEQLELELDEPVDPHKEMMEMLGAIFVQLSRVYDVLMLNLSEYQRDQLDTMHQSGELMGSPPILKEDAWD